MERREFWGHLDHTCALGLLRTTAARACRLHGVPHCSVSVRRTRGAGGFYEDDLHYIVLDPDCGRNLLMLAHELAHHFTRHKHPHAQDHGPAFVRWYAHFLDAWRLIPIEGTVAACRRYGVAIAPVLRLTPSSTSGAI
jgi:hypothetical protein